MIRAEVHSEIPNSIHPHSLTSYMSQPRTIPKSILLYSKVKVCEMKRICNKIWKFSWFLDSQEFLEISRKFSRNFTSRSRSRGIFNSLFTLDLDFETFSFHFSLSISISRHFHFTFHSRNEWTRFSFHFSLLEMSEPDFHFTCHFLSFQYPLSQGTGVASCKQAWFGVLAQPQPVKTTLESL